MASWADMSPATMAEHTLHHLGEPRGCQGHSAGGAKPADYVEHPGKGAGAAVIVDKTARGRHSSHPLT